MVIEEAITEPKLAKVSRTKKKRLQKKEAAKLRKAVKDAQPKPKPKENKMSSSIQLPSSVQEAAAGGDQFVSSLDTDVKILHVIRTRLAELSANVLQIRPVPKKCPPGLLKEMCPLAVSIRFPTKPGAGYAFLHFRNPHDLATAQLSLANALIKGKPVKVLHCKPDCVKPGSNNNNKDTTAAWTKPSERQLTDFDLTRLFVTKLSRATKRFDLAQVFRSASGIELDTFDDKSCRGTCTLSYRSPEAALRAFETRHGTVIRGCPIYVNFPLIQKRKLEANKNKSEVPPSDDDEPMVEDV